jgi:hypothetical protein
MVNHELLLRADYLAAENRILRADVPARLRLWNDERFALAEIGKLGRKGLTRKSELARSRARPARVASYARSRRLAGRVGTGVRCVVAKAQEHQELARTSLRLASANRAGQLIDAARARERRGSSLHRDVAVLVRRRLKRVNAT